MSLRSHNRQDAIYSSDAPTTNIKLGQLWVDTDAAPPVLYIAVSLAPVTYDPVGSGGGGGAPTTAEYIVGALNGSLTNERLVTNTATVTWDLGVAGVVEADVATTGLSLFTSADRGLVTGSGGGTANFIRADGTWAVPPGSTNLTYTAGTRVIASDTGTDATLPLVASADAGLAPASGGGTSNFLRADGTWAVPPGSGGVPDGDKGDITVTASGATWTIDAGAVTLAKMADIATARFIGRVTAATGVPEALTGTQATTLLDAFTSALKGLVPASGGGTTNFLRADGTFAAPPGGGGSYDYGKTLAIAARVYGPSSR